MKWAGTAGSAIVDMGAPVQSVTTVGSDAANLAIGGFSILEADSQEALTKLLEDHPHFHMAGDAAIEVLELQAIPGM